MKTENYNVVNLSYSEKVETTGGSILGIFLLAVIIGFILGGGKPTEVQE